VGGTLRTGPSLRRGDDRTDLVLGQTSLASDTGDRLLRRFGQLGDPFEGRVRERRHHLGW
jgi:hypothetical protein